MPKYFCNRVVISVIKTNAIVKQFKIFEIDFKSEKYLFALCDVVIFPL